MKACAKCGRPESPYDTHCLCGHRYDDPAPAPKQPEVAAFAEAASLPVPDYAAPRSEIVAPTNPKAKQEFILGGLSLFILVADALIIGFLTNDFRGIRMLENGGTVAVMAYVVSFLLSFLIPAHFRFPGRVALLIAAGVALIAVHIIGEVERMDNARGRYRESRLTF